MNPKQDKYAEKSTAKQIIIKQQNANVKEINNETKRDKLPAKS